MNNKTSLTEYLGSAVGVVFSVVQENEILQIISFGITILATLLTITIDLVKIFYKFKKSGKIEDEDVNELKEDVDELKDQTKGD